MFVTTPLLMILFVLLLLTSVRRFLHDLGEDLAAYDTPAGRRPELHSLPPASFMPPTPETVESDEQRRRHAASR